MKKKIIILILLFGLITLFANKVYCQGIEITDGNVLLNISTCTAGEQPDPVSNQDTGLQYYATAWWWWRHKITVQTNLPFPKFTLTVQAINIFTSDGFGASGGTAQGEVTLSTTAQDFIRNITIGAPGAPHSCTLRYTASATVSQGTGTDFHTITYTIMTQ